MTAKRVHMFRLPIFRRRWFGQRELCAIEGQGLNAPTPTTLVKSQKRLRPTAPREVPAFLLLGADDVDAGESEQVRKAS